MYWLWVAKDGGMDDPADLNSEWIWEGCNSETEIGDYALIYRISPHSHIKYLVEITKDSYFNIDLVPDEIYNCEFRVLANLEDELTIDEMKEEADLLNWHPVTINFQGKEFEIEDEYFRILMDLIVKKNREVKNLFKT